MAEENQTQAGASTFASSVDSIIEQVTAQKPDTSVNVNGEPNQKAPFDLSNDIDAIIEKASKEQVEELEGESEEAEDSDESEEPVKKATEDKAEKIDSKKDLEKPKEKVKIIKVKQGDSEISVRDDTEFTVKVSGGTQKVKLKELMGDYSGRVDYNRKYSQLNQEKIAFSKQKTDLVETVKYLNDLMMNQKKPVDAMVFLARALGKNELEAKRFIRAQLMEELKGYSDLSDDDRQAREKDEELNYYKQQAQLEEQNKQKRQAELQQETKLRSEIESVSKRFGETVTAIELNDAWQNLESFGFKKEEMTIPKVGSLVAVNQAIKEVAPDLTGNKEVISDLVEALEKHPELNRDDLRELIERAYLTDSSAVNLSRKVKRSKAKLSQLKAENSVDDDAAKYKNLTFKELDSLF